MAKIAIISKSRLEQSQGAPGKSIIVDVNGHGIDNAEFYQIPGIYNRPQDGITGLLLDCNGNNIVIAGHDYQLNESIEKGETLIYSYDSSGAVLGSVLFGSDGKIKMSNSSQDLKTLIDDLIDAIKNIVTTGSPTLHTVNAASQAALDVIKTNFAALLKA